MMKAEHPLLVLPLQVTQIGPDRDHQQQPKPTRPPSIARRVRLSIMSLNGAILPTRGTKCVSNQILF